VGDEQQTTTQETLPGVLQEWAEIARDTVVDLLQVDGETAARVGREIALRIAEDFGSEQFYLTKAVTYRLDARDREIWNEFTGRNFRELARKHRVSERHVRRLVRRARAIETNRNQGQMFGAAEPPTRR
jgi:Mor family transcriptional regulator